MDPTTEDNLTTPIGRFIHRLVTVRLPLWIPLVCFIVSSVFMTMTVIDIWPEHRSFRHYPKRPYLARHNDGAWQVFPYKRDMEIEYQIEVSDRFWQQQPPGCIRPVHSYQAPTIRLLWAGDALPGPLHPNVAESLAQAAIEAYMVDARISDPAPLTSHDYELRYYDNGYYCLVVFGTTGTKILWAGLFLSIGVWVNFFVFLWSCPYTAVSLIRWRREHRAEWFETNRVCPTCRYDLRGADHLKCPECGNAVPWNQGPYG